MCLLFRKRENDIRTKLYLKAIDHAEQQIQARIHFREQRFYWLYVGSTAIAAFLAKAYSPNSDIYVPIFYGGLALIQFLAIGIGWNYYSNDVKIHKLEWKKNELYWEFGVPPARYHGDGMKLYAGIYTLLEIAAICIPSLGAFIAALAMDIALDQGTPTSNGCTCTRALHYLPSVVSGLIALGTMAGAMLLGLLRKKIFNIVSNNYQRTPLPAQHPDK